MTGFGRGAAACGALSVIVELTSVNRRGLETSFAIPREWQVFERELTEQLRAKIQRGKIHTQIQTDQVGGTSGLSWDAEGLRASLDKMAVLAGAEGIAWPPDANTLLKIVLLHKSDSTLPSPDDAREAVLAAHASALEALELMRADEGRHLAEDLRGRAATLARLAAEIRAVAPATVERYREVLFNRLRLAGLELDLNDERVLKEVALFADRCDIAEELTRLESHFRQFEDTLAEGAANAVGRKLEFLVQEIHREVNTIGSKANNIEISRNVIEMKNEIERIREQVQNVE